MEPLQIAPQLIKNKGMPSTSVAPAPASFLGPRMANYLAALLCSMLLLICYYPLAQGWLAWVALAPLLCLVRANLSAKMVFLLAWLSGLAFFFPILQWLRVADYRMYATWIALAFYCSFYFPLAILLVRRLDRRTRLPLVITVPVVWTSLEFVRAHLMTGFAWYFLSHTQHQVIPLIQIADVTGAYGVTFLVAAVNAFVFSMLFRLAWFRDFLALSSSRMESSWNAFWQGAAILGMVGSVFLYGFWRLQSEEWDRALKSEPESEPRVALIQGNVSQEVRNNASPTEIDATADSILQHFGALSREAARQTPKPDLLVWPETSFTLDWVDFGPDVRKTQITKKYLQPDPKARKNGEEDWRRIALRNINEQALAIVDEWKMDTILGLNTNVVDAQERIQRYNSALLIHADGEPDGRYDKMHRVPFGEYVPLRDWLPIMNKFAPYDHDYSIRPGQSFTRFPLQTPDRDYTFGVIICFEDTDPVLARQYAGGDGQTPVDFILNISNDGWFKGTSEHEEHLAICRFRAVECRRAIGRAVNMGISAIIDGSGRVVAMPGPSWKKSKKVAAVLSGIIPIDHRISLYARWGDWLPEGCGILVLLGFISSFKTRNPG